MDKGIFITLLNPAISAIFAGGFFLLWRHQRERPYIGMLAASYVAAACGFMLQYFTLPIGAAPTRLLSNALFVISAYTLAVGILGRFGRPPPHLALGLLGGGGLVGLSWFMFVDPDVAWRVIAINFAIAGISFLVAAELRHVVGKTFVDQLLMVALLFVGLNFLVRPVAVMAAEGVPAGDGDVFMSLYWIATCVSHAFHTVLLAICLITAIALDVIVKLKSDSLSDPLSGLLNRRGFEEQAGAVLARASASGIPAALVLTDLDHFKSINDSHGHACGDRVIAAFAGVLRDSAGQEGVVGRIGGEEFAVMLPATTLPAARLFAEGVRISFGGAVITGLPRDRSLTASFGVTESTADETLSSLLSRTDVALYKAKRDGRNRICVVSRTASMSERRRHRAARAG